MQLHPIKMTMYLDHFYTYVYVLLPLQDRCEFSQSCRIIGSYLHNSYTILNFKKKLSNLHCICTKRVQLGIKYVAFLCFGADVDH